MKARTVAVIGLAAVVVIGGAAIALAGSGTAPATTYRTVPASLADIEETADATGTLEAATTYQLSFGTMPIADAPSRAATVGTEAAAGSTTQASQASQASQTQATATWVVTSVPVRVGQVVKAGDVLAVADDASAAFAVDIAEQNLAGAEKDLKEAMAGGTATSKALAKTQVTSADAQLRQARTNRANTAAQNANSVRVAKQVLADARSTYADDKAANAADPMLEQDRAAIEQAKRSLTSAKLQARSSNDQASAQVTSARVALTSAKLNYQTATAKASPSTIAAHRVAVDDAERALETAIEALAAATIRAPIDGRVSAIYAVAGSESTGTAITLDSLAVEVRVAVDEGEIASVAVGQEASVWIPPLGETMIGKVTSIDPVAVIGTTTVTRYSVTVGLPAATAVAASTGSPGVVASRLPGMSAEISVVTRAASDVLTVPAAALAGTDGKYTVRILATDGSLQTRDVGVGLLTSDLAEVTSGLAAGDMVVTGSSADLEDASSGWTQPSGSQGDFGGSQP